MQLTVLPLLSEKMENEFDIFQALENTLQKNETRLQEGDVIVISTKYISNSQGRIVDLEKIKASEYGMKIADEYQLKPGIAEIIIRESDKIFGGCNIESSSYGLTCCAERIAIYNAISSGHTQFKALAVATKNGGKPCGACRQVIWDICGEISIYITDVSGNINNTTSSELLPNAFDKSSL